MDIAAQCCMGRNVDEVANPTFMIDRSPGIYYAMTPYPCIGLHKRILHHNRTVTDTCRRRNDGLRMDCLGIFHVKSLGNHFPYTVRPDTYYHRANHFGIACFIYWITMNFGTMGSVVVQSSDIVALSFDDVYYNLGVATGSKKINCCH